jgi:hypothetical protein
MRNQNLRLTLHVRGPNCSLFVVFLHDYVEFLNFFHFLLSNNNFEPENEERKTITEAL